MAKIPTIGTKIKLEGGRAVAEDLAKIGRAGRSSLSGLRQNFRTASADTKRFATQLSSVGRTLGRISGTAARGLTVGVAGGLTAAGLAAEGLRRNLEGTADRILEIERGAKRAGVAFEDYSKLATALSNRFEGVELENVQELLGTFSERIVEAILLKEPTAIEAFEFLGIDPKSLVKNGDEMEAFGERIRTAKEELKELRGLENASLRELAIREAGPNASARRLQGLIDRGNLRQGVQRDIQRAQGRVDRLEADRPEAQLVSATEAFRIISAAVRQAGNSPRVSKALADLGGSDATALGPALNMDPRELQDLIQRADESGAAPDDDDLNRAKRLDRARGNLNNAFTALDDMISEAFGPVQTRLYNSIAQTIRDSRPDIEEFLAEWSKFADFELNALVNLINGNAIPDRVADASWVVQIYYATKDLATVMSELASATRSVAEFFGLFDTGAGKSDVRDRVERGEYVTAGELNSISGETYGDRARMIDRANNAPDILGSVGEYGYDRLLKSRAAFQTQGARGLLGFMSPFFSLDSNGGLPNARLRAPDLPNATGALRSGASAGGAGGEGARDVVEVVIKGLTDEWVSMFGDREEVEKFKKGLQAKSRASGSRAPASVR